MYLIIIIIIIIISTHLVRSELSGREAGQLAVAATNENRTTTVSSDDSVIIAFKVGCVTELYCVPDWS